MLRDELYICEVSFHVFKIVIIRRPSVVLGGSLYCSHLFCYLGINLNVGNHQGRLGGKDQIFSQERARHHNFAFDSPGGTILTGVKGTPK